MLFEGDRHAGSTRFGNNHPDALVEALNGDKMALRFLNTDQSVEAGFRRIAGEQIGKALASLEATGAARPDAVHDVRKRCKKLRGLVRIVRPSFAGFEEENAAFRDIAGLLGSLRDTEVLQETYDAVTGDRDAAPDRSAIAPGRAAITRRREAELAEADLDARFAEAREKLQAARSRAEQWSLDEEGWDALDRGIAKTYARARKAMRKAAKKPTGERHHEWRKRVKYHWHHTRLMRSLWPEQMKQRAKLAHDLANLLGDHHDCHVFERTIAADPEAFGGTEAVETVIALARRRRALIEEKAHRLGARLLAEDAHSLTARWGEWWQAWRSEGDLHAAALAR